jgi:heterodisulfide reductase subunit A-like polyferredoxin
MGLKNALLLAVTAVPLALTAAVEDRGYASAPVCVVGAGPSGLTAAKALEDKGKKVVVFEKRTDVGGKCQSYYKELLSLYCPTSSHIAQANASYTWQWKILPARCCFVYEQSRLRRIF